MPGIAPSIQDMDARRRQGLKGEAFDRIYVDMMTPHHEGTVVMAE
ncbi:DUF305 domain-containing protein [candidate division WOR-3 bacterium]|nr:DUF305 domain-containing protein [candidate division WOR-3 bacterium]